LDYKRGAKRMDIRITEIPLHREKDYEWVDCPFCKSILPIGLKENKKYSGIIVECDCCKRNLLIAS
jgi:hypothetical protein